MKNVYEILTMEAKTEEEWDRERRYALSVENEIIDIIQEIEDGDSSGMDELRALIEKAEEFGLDTSEYEMYLY